ncbi:MAG: hypothetical protein GX609_10130 [Actinomycetales bacterium]|jgi:hypothetical protein|nr:hypothetical protein [Actinomycetales bacterium]
MRPSTARPGARRRALALAVVLAAALGPAGCQSLRGGDADPGAADDATVSPDSPVSPDDPVSDDGPGGGASPTPREPVEPVAADLTVVVDATGEGATTTWTLTCSPTGGDHPDAEAACGAIAAAGGADAFAPTPRDVACTEIWGGPQRATVTGTVGGVGVTARFDRTNGCEISRWDALEPLFGNAGSGL